MNNQLELSYSYTADYMYIDRALKARLEPLAELEAEVAAFAPQKVEDLATYRETEFVHLRTLNAEKSDVELYQYIDSQIATFASSPQLQLHIRFGDRVMAEFITIALLSHALCEASANALLAIGLSLLDRSEHFPRIERKNIIWKWQQGLKEFQADYDLSNSSELFASLLRLTNQRNEFVHYKVKLEISGRQLIRGSNLHRGSLQEHLSWMRRYLSLPYELVDYARQRIPRLSPLMLFDSIPIMRVDEDREALSSNPA